jgi:hypothetical protein
VTEELTRHEKILAWIMLDLMLRELPQRDRNVLPANGGVL